MIFPSSSDPILEGCWGNKNVSIKDKEAKVRKLPSDGEVFWIPVLVPQ